jgi:hypothetical protein
MMGYLSKAAGVMLVLALSEPAAAQRIKAGLLTCDVSAGIGLIITSQKQVSCAFKPDQPGRQEDYDGTITKYSLDLGVTGGGVMMWAVLTDTVAGPGFLAGDYVGASGEASVGAGLGANVLIGGSNPDREFAAGLGEWRHRAQFRGRRSFSSFGPSPTLLSGALTAPESPA